MLTNDSFCLKCGSVPNVESDKELYWIECSLCGYRNSDFNTQELALEDWIETNKLILNNFKVF